MIDLTEMAFRRDDFKNRIAEYLSGAYLEFLTANVFEANGETKYVAHKRSEVDALLQRLEAMQFVETKGGWDVQKAATEAADFLLARGPKVLAAATNKMERYFKRKSVRIDAETAKAWHDDFAARVRDVINSFIS